MPETILAVDPGTSTGYLVVDQREPTKIVMCGQLPPAEFTTFAHTLMPALAGVAVEGVFISHKTSIAASNMVDLMDVLGWVTLECRRRGIPIDRQRPADARAFSTDEKLKHLGWWNLGQARGNRDVRSAARHMLLYLVKHGLLTPRALV